MWQLGKKRYEGVMGFTVMQGQRAGNYAYHELIGVKPKSQRLGDRLEELTLGLRLHIGYCNPAAELADLETQRRVGYILGLVGGDGSYYGDFLLESIGYTIERQGPDGVITDMVLNLALREYWYEARDAAARRRARAEAFAVPGTAREFPNIAPAEPAGAVRTMRSVNAAINTGVNVGRALQNAANDPTRSLYYLRAALSDASFILDTTNQLGEVLRQADPKPEGGGPILDYLNTGFLSDDLHDLRFYIQSGDIANAKYFSAQVTQRLESLNYASQGAAVAAATGKIETPPQ